MNCFQFRFGLYNVSPTSYYKASTRPSKGIDTSKTRRRSISKGAYRVYITAEKRNCNKYIVAVSSFCVQWRLCK